jgi:hypothetical protein
MKLFTPEALKAVGMDKHKMRLDEALSILSIWGLLAVGIGAGLWMGLTVSSSTLTQARWLFFIGLFMTAESVSLGFVIAWYLSGKKVTA